jgi:UDP-N-acetylmuramoyl-L-alanyl-D-glutamate--2,6-diaminopimelate ligase
VPVLHGDPATPVTGVTLSSRTVRPGDLYAALPGQRAHGADYLDEAVRAGAVAVLTDPTGQERARDSGLAVLVLPDPRASLGVLAARVYGDPARHLTSFGVTGTNGKTTTTYLLDAALRARGYRTGLVGTIEIRVGTERVLSTGTTPEAPDLHALLAVMGEHRVEACSMEVSSHALSQHRVDGVVFDVVGFTNLTRDHLDYHHTMEDYFTAKAVLFTPEHARRAVVCVDDDWGRRLAGESTIPVTTICLDPAASADWVVRSVRYDGGLPVAELDGPEGVVSMRCPLPGDFNVANCVLALAMLVDSGIPVTAAAELIAAAGAVPGRMERVTAAADGEPIAVVDYAHSPDAVAKALAALRPLGSPLVVVLGAGGDRDREKRPLMGEAAAAGADVVIVTDDNPRSEDPAGIRAALLTGARRGAVASGARVLQVPDRRTAVAAGVREAWGRGVLLVAGKGHEQGQEIGGTVHPFDDRTELRAALAATEASGENIATMTGEGGAS